MKSLITVATQIKSDEVQPLWIERKLGPYWGLILVAAILGPVFFFCWASNRASDRQIKQFINDPAIRKIVEE